ncbi:MAG: peroxiredoxin [Amphiplicatus sp.]
MKTRHAMMAAAMAAMTAPALAALPVGDKAPDFEAQAALDGGEFTFKLAEALRHGPVVVYFYPKANTRGCDAEAHEFSEKIGEFTALGATVIGLSADDIGTLKSYSVNPETCAGKLAVASDADGSIMQAYDAVASANPARAAMADRLKGLADRTSYVVAPDGEIIFAFNDMKPLGHVSGALEAVKAWAKAHKAE